MFCPVTIHETSDAQFIAMTHPGILDSGNAPFKHNSTAWPRSSLLLSAHRTQMIEETRTPGLKLGSHTSRLGHLTSPRLHLHCGHDANDCTCIVYTMQTYRDYTGIDAQLESATLLCSLRATCKMQLAALS